MVRAQEILLERFWLASCLCFWAYLCGKPLCRQRGWACVCYICSSCPSPTKTKEPWAYLPGRGYSTAVSQGACLCFPNLIPPPLPCQVSMLGGEVPVAMQQRISLLSCFASLMLAGLRWMGLLAMQRGGWDPAAHCSLGEGVGGGECRDMKMLHNLPPPFAVGPNAVVNEWLAQGVFSGMFWLLIRTPCTTNLMISGLEWI